MMEESDKLKSARAILEEKKAAHFAFCDTFPTKAREADGEAAFQAVLADLDRGAKDYYEAMAAVEEFLDEGP